MRTTNSDRWFALRGLATIFEKEHPRVRAYVQREQRRFAAAEVHEVRYALNVIRNGDPGLRIMTRFTAYGMEGVPGQLTAQFCTEDGPLESILQEFVAQDGALAVAREFVPESPVQAYDEFELFLPFTAFDLQNGRHSVGFQVTVWNSPGGEDGDVRELAESSVYTFALSLGHARSGNWR